MSAAELRDDTCLVYRFDADQDDAFWLARQLCEQWLRERHVRADAICDLLLVTTELCTGASDGVVLRMDVIGNGVEVTVESSVGAIVDGPVGDLRLAAALCDELLVKVSADSTVVRARKQGVVLPE